MQFFSISFPPLVAVTPGYTTNSCYLISCTFKKSVATEVKVDIIPTLSVALSCSFEQCSTPKVTLPPSWAHHFPLRKTKAQLAQRGFTTDCVGTLSVSDTRLSALENTNLHQWQKVGGKANSPHEDVYGLFSSGVMILTTGVAFT